MRDVIVEKTKKAYTIIFLKLKILNLIFFFTLFYSFIIVAIFLEHNLSK